MSHVAPPVPTVVIDLDTMAAIAEEAGRDALGGDVVPASFDPRSLLRTLPVTPDALATATRLYGACHRGATDPATD